MEPTVPLTVALRTDHADLGTLERAIGAALAECGQAVGRVVLPVLEAALPAPSLCPSGGTLKARAGRSVTLTGEVALSRQRFRCRACASGVVPLDVALGRKSRIQHSLGDRPTWPPGCE